MLGAKVIGAEVDGTEVKGGFDGLAVVGAVLGLAEGDWNK